MNNLLPNWFTRIDDICKLLSHFSGYIFVKKKQRDDEDEQEEQTEKDTRKEESDNIDSTS